MAGVDKNDRHVADFTTRVRGTQWYKVFLYFGLDAARGNMFQICLSEPVLRARFIRAKRSSVGLQANFIEDLGLALINEGLRTSGSFKAPRRLNFESSAQRMHNMYESEHSRPCNSCYFIASSLQGKHSLTVSEKRKKPFTNFSNKRCEACEVHLCTQCRDHWDHIKREPNPQFSLIQIQRLMHIPRTNGERSMPCYCCLLQLSQENLHWNTRMKLSTSTRLYCSICQVYICEKCSTLSLFDHVNRKLVQSTVHSDQLINSDFQLN